MRLHRTATVSHLIPPANLQMRFAKLPLRFQRANSPAELQELQQGSLWFQYTEWLLSTAEVTVCVEVMR